jgi:hypothetical protein
MAGDAEVDDAIIDAIITIEFTDAAIADHI